MLDALGITVRQDDLVLDLASGMLLDLAVSAAHVILLDTDRERLRHARQLNNVTPIAADGHSLAGVDDASLDGAVAELRGVTSARRALAYVAELGRVLKPGAWAAIALSTEPRGDPEPPPRRQTSRRGFFRTFVGAEPETRRPASRGVPLEALGAVATAAGLSLEQIEGSGTRDTLIRATRSRAS